MPFDPISFAKAKAAAPAPQGNGILVGNGNGRQLVGRSLVPGFGVTIDNPTGLNGDPVIGARQGRVLLTSLAGANLNTTADQALQIAEYPAYIITDIILTNRSATPTAAAGGFYTAPSKGGYVLVPSSQGYTALTDATVALFCTLGPQRMLTGPNIYLSLTTANGAACTADIYVFGYWFTP